MSEHKKTRHPKSARDSVLDLEPELELTAFRGALTRDPLHGWRWRDGAAEPRVRDLRLDDVYRFDTGDWKLGPCVEVPWGLATSDVALRWVLDGCFPIGSKPDAEGTDSLRNAMLPSKCPRSVFLVPIEEWQTRNLRHPIGAAWDAEDEAALLAQASRV